MFKVTARDQGHYKGYSGHLLHTVTFLVCVLILAECLKPIDSYPKIAVKIIESKRLFFLELCMFSGF